jgi:hypothetical protein
VAFGKAQLQQPAITPAAFAEAALGLKLRTHEALLGLALIGGATILGLQAGVRLVWGPSSSCVAACDAAEAAEAVSRLGVSASGRSSTQGAAVGTAPAPLSAVGLVLDMKQAYKHFVEAYLDPIAAVSSLDSSSSSRGSIAGGSGDYWVSKGSPVTLAHLLTLVSALPDLLSLGLHRQQWSACVLEMLPGHCASDAKVSVKPACHAPSSAGGQCKPHLEGFLQHWQQQ